MNFQHNQRKFSMREALNRDVKVGLYGEDEGWICCQLGLEFKTLSPPR